MCETWDKRTELGMVCTYRVDDDQVDVWSFLIEDVVEHCVCWHACAGS